MGLAPRPNISLSPLWRDLIGSEGSVDGHHLWRAGEPAQSDQNLQATNMIHVQMTCERCFNLSWLEPRGSEPLHRTVAAAGDPWSSSYSEDYWSEPSAHRRLCPTLTIPRMVEDNT